MLGVNSAYLSVQTIKFISFILQGTRMANSTRQTKFGQLVRDAREAAGLDRATLAQRVEMDVSHIYRLETSGRQPSRESALALARALGVGDETANEWLVAAGYAPVSLLSLTRATVRTRGGGRRKIEGETKSPHWDTARWAASLEAIGLEETTIGQLLRSMDKVGTAERQAAAQTLRVSFSRVTEALGSPVRAAVIPAAGWQHRLLAPHVMQRLLLRVIVEAMESGIARMIFVLAPGTVDTLYTPLKEALNIAVVPAIKLFCAEQAKPNGLGDAVLRAEALVGNEPFAVLLPDDLIRERPSRTAHTPGLRRMMDAMSRLDNAYLAAITNVPKSRMPQCGVVEADKREVAANLHPIAQLVERPDSDHSIFKARNLFGIVGRYLLQPAIFDALREIKEKRGYPLELTEALEHLRRQGHAVYGFEMEARRHDIGEVLEQASEMIGESIGEAR